MFYFLRNLESELMRELLLLAWNCIISYSSFTDIVCEGVLIELLKFLFNTVCKLIFFFAASSQLICNENELV